MITRIRQCVGIAVVCAAVAALLCGSRSASLFDLPAGTVMILKEDDDYLSYFKINKDTIDVILRYGGMGSFHVKHLSGDCYQFQDPQPPVNFRESAQVTFTPQDRVSDTFKVTVRFGNPKIYEDLDFYLYIAPFVAPSVSSLSEVIEQEEVLDNYIQKIVSDGECTFDMHKYAGALHISIFVLDLTMDDVFPVCLERLAYDAGIYFTKPGCDMEIYLPEFNEKNISRAQINGQIFQYKDNKIYWDGIILEPLPLPR